MDPLKALQDLDQLAAGVSMNREGHSHALRCVAAIRMTLLHPVIPTQPAPSTPQEQG